MSSFRRCASLIASIAAMVLLAEPGRAKTCSDRVTVCQGYCAKSESGSPGCLRACDKFLAECVASGCWESKVVARQCGFEKR